MDINKASMVKELTSLLNRVFQLPEVKTVKIKGIEIVSPDVTEMILKSVDECYHDILSDIDIEVHVDLNPEDAGNVYGYHNNTRYHSDCGIHNNPGNHINPRYLLTPERIGLTRENCLGIALSNGGGLCRLFRIIMKNGIRLDIGIYLTIDDTAPIYIPHDAYTEIKEEGKYHTRWDLEKADSFWFVEIQALAKLLRGDYLIADHLANIQINETLVAQMIERDNNYGTNFHRYGYREILDYKEVLAECQFAGTDDTHNTIMSKDYVHDVITGKDDTHDSIGVTDDAQAMIAGKDDTHTMIAGKLYAAAISYDRLIKRLNPQYEERSFIFFEIWRQYIAGLRG